MAQLSAKPPSRPSSRSSLRNSTASPGPSLEDPVFLRNQMSTLKHDIRMKTAQYSALEAQLMRVPRPLSDPYGLSPPSTSLTLPSFSTSTPRKRGSSLPKHDEGIPMLDVASTPNGYPKRAYSPTKSMNRIPVGSASQGRVLTENGGVVPTVEEPNGGRLSGGGASSPSGLLDPPSPGGVNRRSLSGGNTTKVLADLQSGVMHARQALENTRSQLRLAQRSVAQLTRQNEDLKDGRERLRLQNESLNGVVARKERLLQEMEEVNLKYKKFAEATEAEKVERTKIQALKEESRTLDAKFEEALRDELRSLREAINESSKSSDATSSTAQELSSELNRIRRLMRMVGPATDDASQTPGQ
ncbi:hypothetical protein FS842_001011 [Serendipita sp. 407]|nr:hypothetical protein FS842_001011 [Serendipita sp. 407]